MTETTEQHLQPAELSRLRHLILEGSQDTSRVIAYIEQILIWRELEKQRAILAERARIAKIADSLLDVPNDEVVTAKQVKEILQQAMSAPTAEQKGEEL